MQTILNSEQLKSLPSLKLTHLSREPAWPFHIVAKYDTKKSPLYIVAK